MEQHDFLVALVVFLVAAVVAVPVARRFGLGAVLGYLLAGVAIGPWALRLVTNVESILHFSEFGVVLMIGGNIPGETRTLPIALYGFTQTPDGEAAALRLVVISVILAFGALGASEILARRVRARIAGAS